ncbi:MAG: DUF2955 domain-containing protein [Chromatiaceae bacterium]
MLHPADKAVLRLTVGLGLAAMIAYGLALPLPFLCCLMAVILLTKPGPPLPLVKGLVVALLLAGLMILGVLMVPLLESYPLSGLLLTSVILFALFFLGLRTGNPLTQVLVIAFTLIPVAGVAEQGLVTMIAMTLAVGLLTGIAVSGMAQALFPDPPGLASRSTPPPVLEPASAAWIALRGMLVVMPVFVLALTNPSLYLAAIMNTVTLSQQACSANTRSAGRQLVGSTVMAAALSLLVWLGLSLLPNLWMLMLWLMAAAMWAGVRIYRIRRTRFSPAFWISALTTMLVLLGPAIEDSANGKGVVGASLQRIGLFIGVALYAWAMVWMLERWRASRSKQVPATKVHPGSA